MARSVARLCPVLGLLLLILGPAAAQDRAQRFEQLDQNQDGRLTPDELRRPKIFELLDQNNDGEISRQEAQRFTRRNGDAVEVTYGSDKAQRLDVYRKPDLKSAPIMIYVHGGAWMAGDKSAVGQKADFFRDKDWLFVSANYRLFPEGRHPRNVQDIAAAIDWVYQHASEYGGDPNQIFLMGHSAGCHLVSLVATNPTYLKEHGHDLKMVQGVIALDTVAYDLPDRVGRSGSATYRKVFGNDEQELRDASPQYHVKKDRQIPPFLIAHSRGMGKRVNPERKRAADAFAAVLKEAGGNPVVVDASDRDHGEINQRLGDEKDERVTSRMMEFLESRVAAIQKPSPKADEKEREKPDRS